MPTTRAARSPAPARSSVLARVVANNLLGAAAPWRRVATREPDPGVSILMGAATRSRQWGVLGHAIPCSSTLAAALRRLVRGG